MAHYAFLDNNNVVTEVIVGIDETELIDGVNPEIWYSNFRNQPCVRTSYHGKIRKQYAGIGFTYDPINDVFIAPKPFKSWILDNNYDWQPPIPYPNDGLMYVWNENNQDWEPYVEISES